jgi:phenylacetic acid degradation operon negative regulatory protein
MSEVRTGSARSVLLTLLGEFVEPIGRPVWTASLLHVLRSLGFEDQTARQAIDRASESGWIECTRFGRNVRWELTGRGKELIAQGLERVLSLGGDQQPWTGQWQILFISIPSNRRAVRRRLYAALNWEGFGNPTPGLWLSPHLHRQDEARRIVAEAGLTDSTFAFVGPSSMVGADDASLVRQAWNLDEVEQRYGELLDEFNVPQPPGGQELLLAHVRLVNQGQRLPFLDPQLPPELLGDWIGRRATRLFEQRRAEWGPAARTAWLDIVEQTRPGSDS